jgi:superfamily I DNA and/or RNA helicase
LQRTAFEFWKKIAENSEELWRCWLRIQPSKLDQQARLLGDYSAIVRLMAAGGEGQRPGREVYRRYYELFPKVSKYLPCWAVTSLSARGRIPLEPNFFDLVVIDEASQCDIASALPLLFRAKRAVIIGDPNQLKHISGISPRQDRALLEQHGLVAERAGWSYSTTSLFDLATTLARPADIIVLRDHHRSHADIIGFPNKHFYEGKLRVATKYQLLRPPPRGYPAVRWIDVCGEVRRPPEGGP